MGLIDRVDHPKRLRSATHASALLRALGITRVDIAGLQVGDPEAIAALLGAFPHPNQRHPDDEASNEVEFQLDPRSEDAVRTLAGLAQHLVSLDATSAVASLRTSPDLNQLTRATGEPPARFAGRDLALRAMWEAGHDCPWQLRVAGPSEGALPGLQTLLQASSVPVRAAISQEIEVAARLMASVRHPGATWTGESHRIDWPEGVLHTYLVVGTGFESERREWMARMDRAFAAAESAN